MSSFEAAPVMNTIRAEQLASLDADAERRFRLQVRDHLRAEMPEAVEDWTDEQIDRRIDLAEKSARSCGIDEPVPVVQFICLSVATEPPFDTDPDVKAYLSRRDIDQESKMQAIVDELEDA